MGASSVQLDLGTAERAAQGARGRRGAGPVERGLAGLLLILVCPLLAIAALSVAALSRRSPLIAHWRVGQHGEGFWMLKIRTMWDAKAGRGAWRWIEYLPETAVPRFKGASDPRVISGVAAFYRRFSIDELPQLAHVVSGRMRLIGPRPITQAEWKEYYGEGAAEVLTAPPGLTGLWQVIGRNRLSYAQRKRLDLFYARRAGWRLDWIILRRTPLRVLSGRDAG
ncbi:MAG TPA: sugar transferase [Bryobacteraceae bacterium]|nr:sugar transferase [Bryobacteraceae bacterium]